MASVFNLMRATNLRMYIGYNLSIMMRNGMRSNGRLKHITPDSNDVIITMYKDQGQGGEVIDVLMSNVKEIVLMNTYWDSVRSLYIRQ